MNAIALAQALADDAAEAGVDFSATAEKMRGLAVDAEGVELVCEIAASSLALLISPAQDFEEYQEEVSCAFDQLERAAAASGMTPRFEAEARAAREEAVVEHGAPSVPYRLIP